MLAPIADGVSSTVIIALYRPFLLKSPAELPQWRRDSFYTMTLQKVKTAASSTTAILSELITFDLIDYCSSVMLVSHSPQPSSKRID
jgi:hypothetical protein